LIKIVSLAAGTLVLFVSLILYLRFTRDNAHGEKSLTWPVTPGRITESRIEVREHRTTATDYDDVIEYEYTVSNRVYRNRAVDLKIRDWHDRVAIRAFVDSYPVGKEVAVHYDPENPGDALLVAGPALETSGPRLLAAKILLPAGLVLLVLPLWIGKRNKSSNSAI
jgi:hypothetical protein